MSISLRALLSRLVALAGFGTIEVDAITDIGMTAVQSVTVAFTTAVAAILGVVQHHFDAKARAAGLGSNDVLVDPADDEEAAG